MEDEDSLGGSAYANYLRYTDKWGASLGLNSDNRGRSMLADIRRYTDPYEAAVRAQEEIDEVARTAQRPDHLYTDGRVDTLEGLGYAIQEMERNRTSKYYEKEKEPEVEPDSQSLEIILRRMKLGLNPYVYEYELVSATGDFICCDIDEFDPDNGRHKMSETVHWLHPRIYEKIKAKCKDIQEAMDLMDKTAKEYADKRDEIKTTILSLVESTKNLETKGHDFIL